MFQFKQSKERKEIKEVLEKMGEVFYQFHLVSDVFSIFAGRYQLPLAPSGRALLVGNMLKIPIRTDLLPKGVFLEDLEDERLLSALKAALGRNVETRQAPRNSLSSLLYEKPKKNIDVAANSEFWYFVELNRATLRGIPRQVSALPNAPVGRLPVPFGRVAGGNFYWFDFPEEVIGLLVAGATRSGKSVWLKTILSHLSTRYTSAQFTGYLADFKFGVEFGAFAHLPHFQIFDTPEIYLDVIRQEMKRRYELIKRAGCVNVLEFNDRFPQNAFAYSLAVIDEVAMFKMRAGKTGMEDLITLVAQSAGAGIYHILSTQRPSVDIVSGSLKANLGARVSFSQPTQVDYDVIFGESALEQNGPLGCPGRAWSLVGDRLFEFQAPYLR